MFLFHDHGYVAGPQASIATVIIQPVYIGISGIGDSGKSEIYQTDSMGAAPRLQKLRGAVPALCSAQG